MLVKKRKLVQLTVHRNFSGNSFCSQKSAVFFRLVRKLQHLLSCSVLLRASLLPLDHVRTPSCLCVGVASSNQYAESRF